MKQFTYPKHKIIFNYFVIILLVTFASGSVWALIVSLFVKTPFMVHVDSILEIFAAYVISMYLFKSNTTLITFDSQKLSRVRKGKVKQSIYWSDIKDFGIGKVITPLGFKERLYFSTKKLTTDEKNNLSLADSHCLYLSHISDDARKALNEYFPEVAINQYKANLQLK